MVLRQIYALYFSPTGGTEKIVSSIADTLSRLLELPVHSIDFTCLENRQKEIIFQMTLLSLSVLLSMLEEFRIRFFLISRNVS